jgi:hypothetical protein
MLLPEPSPDPIEILSFLKGMKSGSRYDLVAIEPDGKVSAKTFQSGREGDLVEWIIRKNKHQNIYFHVNTVAEHVRNRKAKKEEIVEVVALKADVDDKEALPRIRAHQPPPPLIVFTGGGFQPYWFLRTATNEFGRVERINMEIARQLGGDHTHNVDRLFRVPGTVNWPNNKKRLSGRTPERAFVVEADWSRVYELADFSEGPEPAGPKGAIAVAGGAAVDVVAVGLDSIPQTIDQRIRRVIETGDDPDRPRGSETARYPSRSEAVFHVACELARAGVLDTIIAGILVNRDFAISESILERKDAKRHALKQARAAYAEISNEWPDADGKGRPRSTMRNAAMALRRLGLHFSYDLFRNRKVIGGHALEEYAGEISDDASLVLRGMIIDEFAFDPGSQNVFDAVSLLCLENAHHPIIEMLDSLKWDGIARLDRWLATYLGAGDTALNAVFGAKTLIAAVRRIRVPGTKFDQMLVLEGAQGTGKSSAVAILAGPGNHSDQELLTLDAKTQMEMLDGIWLFEIGEVEGMGKAAVNKIKAFVSRTEDRARMAYARHSVSRPRQVTFIGTTNESKYLRDETGNRRFWPVKTGQIDLDRLKEDRNQLWAEAAYREAKGESVGLPKDLWEAAAVEQAERLEEDPWGDLLETAVPKVAGNKLRLYTSSLLEDTLGISRDRQNQGQTKRLSGLMKKLGWREGKFKVEGKTVRGYEKDEPVGYVPSATKVIKF